MSNYHLFSFISYFVLPTIIPLFPCNTRSLSLQRFHCFIPLPLLFLVPIPILSVILYISSSLSFSSILLCSSFFSQVILIACSFYSPRPFPFPSSTPCSFTSSRLSPPFLNPLLRPPFILFFLLHLFPTSSTSSSSPSSCFASSSKSSSSSGPLLLVSPLPHILFLPPVGRGGALVKSMTLNWRVVGSTPAIATT